MLRRLFLYCLRKPIPFFALGIAGAACLAFLQQAVVSFAADRAEPGRGACWIWAQDAANAAQPLAFWAVRDFQLMDPADLESASVVIAADESYELWLNGQRVGAGEYVQGMAADQYSVSHLLQLGSNRLVVELRSSRGAGGLLASVRSGDRILFSSDDSWRIVHEADPAVLRGSKPLDGLGEDVKVWSDSSTGRFRLSGFKAVTIKERSWLEPGHRTPALPERLRHLSERASWKQIKPSPGRLPARQTVFDFGRQVSGYLEMELAEEGDAGLVFFGDEEPPAQEGRPSVIVSPFPGRRHWRDIKPRTFRYVALVGLPALRRLEVVEVPAEEAEAVDPGSPFRGVFGLPPAQPYLPVEEAVWDRLKELAAHPDDPSSDLDEDMAPSPADS